MGDDSLAEQLRKASEREGVLHLYDVHEGEKTGACAVIITGHNRCVPNFGASTAPVDSENWFYSAIGKLIIIQ